MWIQRQKYSKKRKAANLETIVSRSLKKPARSRGYGQNKSINTILEVNQKKTGEIPPVFSTPVVEKNRAP